MHAVCCMLLKKLLFFPVPIKCKYLWGFFIVPLIATVDLHLAFLLSWLINEWIINLWSWSSEFSASAAIIQSLSASSKVSQTCQPAHTLVFCWWVWIVMWRNCEMIYLWRFSFIQVVVNQNKISACSWTVEVSRFPLLFRTLLQF